jgi:peptide chain release factor subunit 1
MKTFKDRVLILTPVKNAAVHLPQYFRLLDRVSYPGRLISLGFLESDSSDGTYRRLAARKRRLGKKFRRVDLWRRHFNLRIPEGVPRWALGFQAPRRQVLAKSRNHLLFRSLRDEDWVLWLDVDVVDYPPDMIETLLSTGRDIVHPHCVTEYGGPTFDRNAWREHGERHMDELRGESDFVRLDAVGGTALLVRADLHRDGLIFPPYFYGRASSAIRPQNPMLDGANGEIETEGFGIMALDMGYQCWGMPNYEIKHARE